ncbi:MAG: hypothetical protein WC934_14945 [Acidithiobacillus sp.]|jgi:hypothetical protein|uniref:hypothetical protein n=1 Tax=Acidithiobacillus sp. TaxID=1872118 RepID=UPI00356095D7
MRLKDALKSSFSLTTLFDIQIDKMLREYQEQQQKERPSKTFHVSGLITEPENFCSRQKILSYNEPDKHKQDLTGGTRRIFWNGNIHHAKWQGLFLHAKIAEKIEVTHYSKKLHLTGTPDGIIWLWNKLYVCEIKTMRMEVFRSIKTPPKAATIQANFYMYLTGIPRAVILCDNKNDHSIKTFWIDFDPTLLYTYLSQHDEVLKYYRANKIPPKTCMSAKDKLAKKCKYCDYCFK